MIEISVGHTPDADDAFMFYGIVSGKAKSSNFKIKHVVKDIETLNKAAFKHELHITAVSAHAYYYLSDYQILRYWWELWIKLWAYCPFQKATNTNPIER